MLNRDDDMTGDLLRAFEDRGFAASPAGQFAAEQEAADRSAQDAEHQQKGRDWLHAQGLGDALPSPADYDYARMMADDVYPQKDAAGRVPLPPQYWKPGRLIVNGVDLSSGRRILSRAPLEDRLLGLAPDDDTEADDIASILAGTGPEHLDELPPTQRRALDSWLETHGVMVAQGGTQGTASDAAPAAAGTVRGRGQQAEPKLSDLVDQAKPVQALWDLLAGGLKGAVAQSLGLPGDVESLVRMLTNTQDGQHMLTTEQVSDLLPEVIPGGDPQRIESANLGQQIGEVVGLGKADVAGKAVKKAAQKAAPMVKAAPGAAAAAAGAGAVSSDTQKGQQ